MTTRHLLADFVEKYPQFDFDLLEHVEASQVISAARDAHDEFLRQSCLSMTVEAAWKSRRDAIGFAVAGIEAYRGIDWERDDYQNQLPFIDKSGLRTAPERYLSPNFDRARLWSRETSGTSGPPINLYYAPAFFAGLQYFSACKLVAHAGLLDQEMLDRPVFCMMVVNNRYLRDRVWLDPSDYTGMTLRPVFDESDRTAGERLLELILHHRPAVLSLGPHILEVLLAQLGTRSRLIGDHVAVIISGGSKLTAELREATQQAIRRPVLDAYGMTEIGEIASECQVRRGLHLHEATVIAEVLREDGSLGATGRGELVVSSIMNRAMPLLRYRTADRVEIVDEACACGRPGRRITSLFGREVQPFLLADGSYFAPNHLVPLFKRYGLREFQVTLEAANHIGVKVEFDGEPGNTTAILQAIQADVTRAVNAPVSVEVAEFRFIPGAKFQRYRIGNTD